MNQIDFELTTDAATEMAKGKTVDRVADLDYGIAVVFTDGTRLVIEGDPILNLTTN